MQLKTISVFFLLLIFNLQAFSDEDTHLKEALKIYDVSMGEFNMETARRYTSVLEPSATGDRKEEVTKIIYQVMTSKEFRLEYAKVMMKIFTEEECKRLAEILTDPVLAKYRLKKPEYTREILRLAQELLLNKL